MRIRLKILVLSGLLAFMTLPVTGQELTERDLIDIVERITRINEPGKAVPRIEFTEDAKSMDMLFIARADPKVKVGRGILKFCDSFGDYASDALAFVVSHELAHYYGRDEIRKKRLSQQVLEQLADFDALFMTFKAGYRSMAVAQEVLTGLYSQMRLNVDGDYPALNIRVESIAETVASFEKEVLIYQAASFLYYQKDYVAASQLFERLSAFLDVPEVKNALAASLLNQAIEDLPVGKPFYALPVEVDPGIRLERRLQRSVVSVTAAFTKILGESISLLEDLTRYEPDYQPAIINLTIAHYLAGNIAEAEVLLAQYKGTSKQPANYALMSALIAEASGDAVQANNWFEQSLKAGDYEAEYNYELFKTEPANKPKRRSGLIRQYLMSAPAQTMPADWTNPEPGQFQRLTTLNKDEIVKVSVGVDKELVLEINQERGGNYLLFPGFHCTTCNRESIEKRRQQVLTYKRSLKAEDYKVIPFSGMEFWLVKSDNLLLFVHNGELIGWFRYQIS